MTDFQSAEASLVFDFCDQFHRDHAQGTSLPLAHYLSRFPGHDAAIAREYLRLLRTVAQPEKTASPGGSTPRTSRDEDDPSRAEHALSDTPSNLDEQEDSLSAVVARLSGRAGFLERYEIKDEIGRGGMGAILKIWDQDLRRHLAMKVLRVSLWRRAGNADAAALALMESRRLGRFLEEAQVTGQLDHPGIVPVHELGLDPEGRLYFTMKLVKGRTLKEVFDLVAAKREGWTETKTLGVLLKVCEAMSYAHHKGVIHRDLKPANVMVGKFGEVHVMDWGLARILGRKDERDLRVRDDSSLLTSEVRSDRGEHRSDTPDSPLYTMDGDIVGTPAYMPPEQAAGKVDEIGPHSDVYALGAMLYHLFAGHMPYVPPGARLTNYVIWGLVQQGPPPPIATLAPRMPVELVAICEKAMARDWRARYRDMSELASDLSAYLEGRVVNAYETGAWAEAKKWVERNRPLATSLAAGVLALIAGLIASVLLGRKAEWSAQLAEERRIESERSAREARENEARAIAGESEAMRQGEIAKRNLEGVLSLSAIQDLTELETEADRLWPAEPALLSSYDAWLARARQFVDGGPADPSRGIERQFGLADHRGKLAEIRHRAKPLTEKQREADRRSSASYADWQTAREERTWIARMLGGEPWESEGDGGAHLAEEMLTKDAAELNQFAWSLVDPDPRKAVFGKEMTALRLAHRAVAVARDEDRAAIRDTLAWALYKTGRLDEAVAEERRAVDQASDDVKDAILLSSVRLHEAVASWREDVGRSQHSRRKAELEKRIEELQAEIDLRRTWEFEVGSDAWWNVHLSRLVDGIESFQDPETGLLSKGISSEHSWGVGRRREFAAMIERWTVSGDDAKERWAQAIAAVAAAPQYEGLRLEPQLGLLPIGSDPESGLWEFSHLASAEGFGAVRRGPDGRVVLEDGSGIVLVLIPGGKFRMGAQSTDTTGESYDPQALDYESLVHEVWLQPFLLSKYEMTQAQWQRLMGSNPSAYSSLNYEEMWDAIGRLACELHPVEQVSWEDCMRVLPRFRLTLPTEAQWEYACRAGKSTVYWSGNEMESLRGVENLSDAYGRAHTNQVRLRWEQWLDDGQTMHAVVGSYRANPFGLHDVHGNVSEWCRDNFGGYGQPVREGDGERQTPISSTRIFRGGSFLEIAAVARSATRLRAGAERRINYLGVRPAASLARR